jgi:hypothetical protein
MTIGIALFYFIAHTGKSVRVDRKESRARANRDRKTWRCFESEQIEDSMERDRDEGRIAAIRCCGCAPYLAEAIPKAKRHGLSRASFKNQIFRLVERPSYRLSGLGAK